MDKERLKKLTSKEAQQEMASKDELSQRLESYLPITPRDSLKAAVQLYIDGYRKLSDPNIVEVDRDAELPMNELKTLGGSFQGGYYVAQQDMLKAGWVLPKKEVTK